MPLLNYFTSSGLRADGEKREVTVAQGARIDKGDFISTGLDITGLAEGTALAFSTCPVYSIRCLKLSEERILIFYPEHGADGRNIYASLIGIENGEMTVISETDLGYRTNGSKVSMNANLLSDGTVLFIYSGTNFTSNSIQYTYWYGGILQISNDEISVGKDITLGRTSVYSGPSESIPPEIHEISGTIYYIGSGSSSGYSPHIIPLTINELTIEKGTATLINDKSGWACWSCLLTPNTILVANEYIISHITVIDGICTVQELGSVGPQDGMVIPLGFNRFMRFAAEWDIGLFQYQNGVFTSGVTRKALSVRTLGNYPGVLQTTKKYILFVPGARGLEVYRPLLGEVDREGMEFINSFPLPDNWTGTYGNIIEFSKEKILGAYPYYLNSSVKELRCRMFSMKEVVMPARNQATGIALSSGEPGETITISTLV